MKNIFLNSKSPNGLAFWVNRYTWVRRCFICEKITHTARAVDFGVDHEDVCIPCCAERKYKPDRRYHQREENFVVVGLIFFSISGGICIGIYMFIDILKFYGI